jgi:ATP-dependent Lhr-like helicase
MAALTRVVPMSLFLRTDLPWLQTNSTPGDVETLSSPARQLIEHLQRVGALFAADLLQDLRLLPSQVNEVLGELVTAGRVTSDGFAGLRMLLHERSRDSERRQLRSRQRGTRRRLPLSGSGRWSLWRRAEDGDVSATSSGQPLVDSRQTGDNRSATGAPAIGTEGSAGNGAEVPRPTGASNAAEQKLAAAAERREVVEQWAWQLLRRWGVMFRDLLEREDGAPRWFELLQVYRRLEARGEIRGGRFIAGVAGEQFALGDSVKLLRRLREEGPQQELVVISAVDPLNLVGVLTSQDRVTRTAANKVVLLDGVAVAAVFSGEVQFPGEPGDRVRRRIQQALSNREPVLETQPAETESAETESAETATEGGFADKSPAAENRPVETQPRRQTSLFSRRR